MSLKKVQRKYKADFEPLTTTQWIINHADELDLKKTDEQITYHDSCNLSRKIGLPKSPRELLSKMVDLKELERSGRQDTYCCGYWNMHANHNQTHAIHEKRFEEVKSTGAKKMVCECITCAESFTPDGKQHNIEVEDIVQTVYNNIFSGQIYK